MVAAPIAILAIVYACSGLIELLHYFYRGLSRSDVESSLILWQRGGTLVCGLLALAWKPDVTRLALAMLIPVAVTLAVSLRIASRLGADTQVWADTRVRPYDESNVGADPRVGPAPSLAVFRRDATAGKLSETGKEFAISKPQCLLFV